MTESNAQQRWVQIAFTPEERARIKTFADRGHRNLRGQIIVWLEAAEALMADVTPDLLDKIETRKKLRATEPEA